MRLRAKPSGGETDIGYGLVVGDDDLYLLVALSPLGYLTVRYVSDTDEANSGDATRQQSKESGLPWQTWPHIRTGEQSNEIWLDVNDGAVSGVRINRELLQTEDFPLRGNQIGLWVESFGDSAEIDFAEMELFY